jgi:hypothetical protein
MSDRGVAFGVILALAVVGQACGRPEDSVVSRYFDAVNAKDSQTVTSFALVNFDKKVDKWSIVNSPDPIRAPAPLPELVKKAKAAEAALADNTKAARSYNLEHFKELDQVREIEKKNGKMPANLATVAAEWAKFNKQDRDLKKLVADAKAELEREKRVVGLSLVGAAEDVESLTGEMITKPVDLVLTIAGQPQNYVMTVRKYELHKADKGPAIMSRWVVLNLEPKA